MARFWPRSTTAIKHGVQWEHTGPWWREFVWTASSHREKYACTNKNKTKYGEDWAGANVRTSQHSRVDVRRSKCKCLRTLCTHIRCGYFHLVCVCPTCNPFFVCAYMFYFIVSVFGVVFLGCTETFFFWLQTNGSRKGKKKLCRIDIHYKYMHSGVDLVSDDDQYIRRHRLYIVIWFANSSKKRRIKIR